MLLILLSTLLVLALLYGGVCAFYWLFQERFIFVRFRVAQGYVFKFAQPLEEVFLKMDDGARLHALRFTVEKPRGVILYFHGNTGSLRRWGKRAKRFIDLGYDVLMMDYRGYGKSRGAINEAVLHADADKWFAHAMKLYGEENVVVYGRSLGSGFAVPLAATRAPRMLILESPFASLLDIASYQFPLLPYRWLLRYPMRSDKAMLRVKCPVYIFHGKRDPVVPYKSALRLYSLVPSDTHREMITFAKGFHSDLGSFRRFQRKLDAILGGVGAERDNIL